MKLKTFLNELYHRAKLESPSFFKLIQRFGIILSTVSILQQSIKDRVPNFTFPHFVNVFFDYATVVGITIVFFSKLTVKDTVELEKKMNSQNNQ